MKKIDYYKIKSLDFCIEDIDYSFSMEFPLFFVKFPLSDSVVKYSSLLLGYNNLSEKDILSLLESSVPFDEIITQDEVNQIYCIYYNVTHFFTGINIWKPLTFDEMEYCYQKLKDSNKINNEEAKMFEIYLSIRKEKIDKIYNVTDTELENIIIGMSKKEIEEIKSLLGFDKKSEYMRLSDYTNYKKITETYVYNLTDDEKRLDSLIDKYIEKKTQKEESEYGLSFFQKVYFEFSKYSNYGMDMLDQKIAKLEKIIIKLPSQYKSQISQTHDERSINNTRENEQGDLINLQQLHETMSNSTKKLLDDKSLINDMISLDELLNYRNDLDENLFWLKKAITDAVQKLNQRIIDFNKAIANGTAYEELKNMSLWQKQQLLLLRLNSDSEQYLHSSELSTFTFEATSVLYKSIKEDELKEAQTNGFDTYDEYMMNLYENEIRDKEVIDFRQLYIIKYYKDKANNKKSNPKK